MYSLEEYYNTLYNNNTAAITYKITLNLLNINIPSFLTLITSIGVRVLIFRRSVTR